MQELIIKIRETISISNSRASNKYHCYGLYTIIVGITFIFVFNLFYEIFHYGRAKYSGNATSILKIKSEIPIKKSLFIRVPAYLIGFTVVFPCYFLPRIIAEITVEIFWKLRELFDNIIYPKIIRLTKAIILKLADVLIFIHYRILDAYIEQQYLWSMIIQMLYTYKLYFDQIINVFYFIKETIVTIALISVNICSVVWSIAVGIFV
jgi:hypothetical protein